METCHECKGAGCEVCNDLGWHHSRSLRITLAPEPETVTPPHVAQAISDCAAINADGRQWASLDIVPTKNGVICRMDIGDIHSNGFRECSIVTRDYFVDIADKQVKFTKHVHV